MTERCMCGDPYCFHCGDPGLIDIEATEDGILDFLREQGATLEELHAIAEVVAKHLALLRAKERLNKVE